MGRAPSCDKNGLKKGPWSPDEDQKLIDYIQEHGHGCWQTLPKNAGLLRCGKSCRLRWTNYLRLDIKRGRFSFEEEETIIQLHCVLGNKWSAIAARLPGRTDNEIKNYWNTHIRKRLLRMGIDPVTHSPRLDLDLDLLGLSSILNSSSLYNSSQLNVSRLLGIHPLANPVLLRLATSLLSTSQGENSDLLQKNLTESQHYNPQILNQISLFHLNQLQTTTSHEIPTCTTSTAACVPFLNETQVMQTNVEEFQSNPTNFTCQNYQPNVMEENVIPSNLTENLVPIPNYAYYNSDQSSLIDPLSENLNFKTNNSHHHDFNIDFVLSTPSSSSTLLNSCSTYINGSTEDERDSFCSDMLQFEMPDILGINDFM